MNTNMNTFKRELGHRWVKAESGNTYLCPINAMKGLDNPTEEDLRARCVNESFDPHNQ